jgi:hypothetical protein
MSQITIETDDSRIVIHTQRPADTRIGMSTLGLPESAAHRWLALKAGEAKAAAFPRYIKVDANGERLPANSSRTDHVAVIDTTTGLMWAVESLGSQDDADKGINQEACTKRCADLRLLGFDDWRLPTRTELAALIDDCQHEPAIDTDAFPRVKPRWHWTSTPAAWSSASAWLVYFLNGIVDFNHRFDDGFALAVRRAGQ